MAISGVSTSASTIATIGENGSIQEPKAPKNTRIDRPADRITEPKPTGLIA